MADQLITFTGLVLMTMVPYVLASQGTMLGGRAGVFSVSQEGIMLVGASVGFLGAHATASLAYGMLLAMLAGGLFGLALAYFTTTLRLNQFVIGLALFFSGLGLSTLFYKVVIGVTLAPPLIPTLPTVPIPGVSRVPVLGPVLFQHNLLVYVTLLLSAALYYVLYHTPTGLALRAVGEHPMAADSLGVNVALVRYASVILGGMMMGLAGAYLPMVYTGAFTEGMVRGRGWLAIALTFFGGWSPHLIVLGALFFAAVEILSFGAQIRGVALPYQFLQMLPYVATILIMIPAFRRVRVPAFLGQNYHREKRTLA